MSNFFTNPGAYSNIQAINCISKGSSKLAPYDPTNPRKVLTYVLDNGRIGIKSQPKCGIKGTEALLKYLYQETKSAMPGVVATSGKSTGYGLATTKKGKKLLELLHSKGFSKTPELSMTPKQLSERITELVTNAPTVAEAVIDAKKNIVATKTKVEEAVEVAQNMASNAAKAAGLPEAEMPKMNTAVKVNTAISANNAANKAAANNFTKKAKAVFAAAAAKAREAANTKTRKNQAKSVFAEAAAKAAAKAAAALTASTAASLSEATLKVASNHVNLAASNNGPAKLLQNEEKVKANLPNAAAAAAAPAPSKNARNSSKNTAEANVPHLQHALETAVVSAAVANMTRAVEQSEALPSSAAAAANAVMAANSGNVKEAAQQLDVVVLKAIEAGVPKQLIEQATNVAKLAATAAAAGGFRRQQRHSRRQQRHSRRQQRRRQTRRRQW